VVFAVGLASLASRDGALQWIPQEAGAPHETFGHQHIAVPIVAAEPEQQLRSTIAVVITGVDESHLIAEVSWDATEQEPVDPVVLLWRAVAHLAVIVEAQRDQFSTTPITIRCRRLHVQRNHRPRKRLRELVGQ